MSGFRFNMHDSIRNSLTESVIMITVNTSDGKKNIKADSITYLRSEGKKTELYLEDNTIVIASHLLKWFGERLDAEGFSRCHKSYIVNMQKVDYFCYDYLILDNKEWIPVRRGMRDGFTGKLKSGKQV
jgi:DNA-binding LytR/AlgR family response regulator